MTEQKWPIAVTIVITKEDYDLNAGIPERLHSLITFRLEQAKFMLQDALWSEALAE